MKELAYKPLVRPTLEHASTVCSPHLKKKGEGPALCICMLHIFGPKDSPTDMLQTLKWETLEQRQLKPLVVMGYRIVHGLVGIPSD